MTGEDLELSSVLLIPLNGIARPGFINSSASSLDTRVRLPNFVYNMWQEIASLGFISTYPKRRGTKVKKLLTIAFALALTASLSFAQASGSSDQSGTSGSTASSGQTSTGDQSTTKTTKKHHKKHKKSTTDTSSSSSSGASSSNPK